jgi:hypothetical protein
MPIPLAVQSPLNPETFSRLEDVMGRANVMLGREEIRVCIHNFVEEPERKELFGNHSLDVRLLLKYLRSMM